MPALRRLVAVVSLSVALVGCAASTARESSRPDAPAPESTSRVVILSDARDARRHDGYHYAPVVRAGALVILSGIPAGPGADDESKIRAMFEEAKRKLADAGATFADVIEITTFHAQVKSTEEFDRAFATISKVHAEYFAPPYPAWTAIGNAVLLAPDAPVEMRVVAVVGSGRGARLERRGAAAK